jgi:hypothetical protein
MLSRENTVKACRIFAASKYDKIVAHLLRNNKNKNDG